MLAAAICGSSVKALSNFVWSDASSCAGGADAVAGGAVVVPVAGGACMMTGAGAVVVVGGGAWMMTGVGKVIGVWTMTGGCAKGVGCAAAARRLTFVSDESLREFVRKRKAMAVAATATSATVTTTPVEYVRRSGGYRTVCC